jgi:radical SAM-linked protein
MPEVSYLEGLWARGDRRLAHLLVAGQKKGCQFDGWTDFFNYDLWREAIEKQEIDTDMFVTRGREFDEPLPWDHIDIGVSKSYLRREWDRGHQLQGPHTTDDCRTGECTGCGVCDFQQIQPRVYKSVPDQSTLPESSVKPPIPELRKFHIIYSKLEDARFFGHLELINIFGRALRRADIPVGYTQGYHPKPKISFGDALPIGIESHAEIMVFSARANMDYPSVPQKLNAQLPTGLRVSLCKPGKFAVETYMGDIPLEYGIYLLKGNFLEEKLKDFQQSSSFPVSKKNRKGQLKTMDLKSMIEDIQIRNYREMRLVLLSDSGPHPRPALILNHVFGLDEEAIKTARIIKYPELSPVTSFQE